MSGPESIIIIYSYSYCYNIKDYLRMLNIILTELICSIGKKIVITEDLFDIDSCIFFEYYVKMFKKNI